jgi:hypothetical protein
MQQGYLGQWQALVDLPVAAAGRSHAVMHLDTPWKPRELY